MPLSSVVNPVMLREWSLTALEAAVGTTAASVDQLPTLPQMQVQLWLELAIADLRSQLEMIAHQAEPDAASFDVLLTVLTHQLKQRLNHELSLIATPTNWPLGEPTAPIAWLDITGSDIAGSDITGSDHDATATLSNWRTEVQQAFLERAIAIANQQLRSLTAQQELNALRHRNRELRQISQLKSEFLANTSHEIRTPLSSILGFTHLLREQGFTPDNLRHQEYLRIILTSGQHLLALINDILDLSKIEANQMDLHWEETELRPLCKVAMTLVQEKANDKGLALKLDIAPECDRIQVDPLRLKQMLFNLLSNALKFTTTGQVGLRLTPDQQFLRFTVWDTGAGIPADQQTLLFRAYKQLPQSETNRSGGTGLGLALTQKLAELHGGWIEVQSTVGEGSAFTIVLPLAPATALLPPVDVSSEVDAAPMIARTEPPTGPLFAPLAPPVAIPKKFRKATRSYHLLIVEDNPDNARLVITYLSKLGYEVTLAQNSEEMWRSLQRSLPALILMDVNLPDVDGLTLTQQLRDDDRYREIPIIAQTAMAMAGDREICLAAGVNEYVSKPLDLPKLADVIGRYSDA
jgi:signal transduction histidine kinase/ActR/RegA family two-component response regulator